jgi:hypothetical protein
VRRRSHRPPGSRDFVKTAGGFCVDTISVASNDPAVAPFSSPANWLCRLRAVRGYDFAIRSFGSAWFLILALVLARKAFEPISVRPDGLRCSRASACFCSIWHSGG